MQNISNNRLFTNQNIEAKKQKTTIISSIIALIALGLAYAPLPGIKQTIVVVGGTELAEPLQLLEEQFEAQNPNLELELKFQGSQDIINNYIDNKNDFNPTIVIPASGKLLTELEQRWKSQNQSEPFYNNPQPIAKTFLVGIAWPERGKILFPNGNFNWGKIEQGMLAKNWGEIGGKSDWGSFDFLTTDVTRSNSGQLTLSLWYYDKLGGQNNFSDPKIESLFKTIKKSVYLPPRSTDILLQEFITRGPNDSDIATVYESIALYRWEQSQVNQSNPYQIYYLNPTIETVATAAIVRRDVGERKAKAAQEFINFITQPEQQKVFVKYGFRPIIEGIDLSSVPNSPWAQNIPGTEVNPSLKTLPPPNPQQVREMQRLWQRVD